MSMSTSMAGKVDQSRVPKKIRSDIPVGRPDNEQKGDININELSLPENFDQPDRLVTERKHKSNSGDHAKKALVKPATYEEP